MNGIPPSWSFYYPHRVAPFISDLVTNLKFKNSNINKLEFIKGVPYTPLQQLMIIMPPQMKKSLPKECVKIMNKKELKKYFPTSFKLDALAGLKYIYAEPLLNEINDDIILDELEKVMDKLTSVWKSRRVWVAVAGVAVACAHTLGVDVDPETVQYVVLLAASWIVGDSLRKTE